MKVLFPCTPWECHWEMGEHEHLRMHRMKEYATTECLHKSLILLWDPGSSLRCDRGLQNASLCCYWNCESHPRVVFPSVKSLFRLEYPPFCPLSCKTMNTCNNMNAFDGVAVWVWDSVQGISGKSGVDIVQAYCGKIRAFNGMLHGSGIRCTSIFL